MMMSTVYLAQTVANRNPDRIGVTNNWHWDCPKGQAQYTHVVPLASYDKLPLNQTDIQEECHVQGMDD